MCSVTRGRNNQPPPRASASVNALFILLFYSVAAPRVADAALGVARATHSSRGSTRTVSNNDPGQFISTRTSCIARFDFRPVGNFHRSFFSQIGDFLGCSKNKDSFRESSLARWKRSPVEIKRGPAREQSPARDFGPAMGTSTLLSFPANRWIFASSRLVRVPVRSQSASNRLRYSRTSARTRAHALSGHNSFARGVYARE